MLDSMMLNDYVKVKKGTLEDCLTCPLCFNLLKEATTICLCLHTFCKECIYEKLEDDQTNCCPMCNVYLGCSPREKLRPDNNLHDLRIKIFPLKNKAREPKTTIAPTRRKKRYLSSLVIDHTTTKKTSLSRGKTILNKPAGMSKEIINKRKNIDTNVKEENTHFDPSSSHECLNKLPMIPKKQRLSGNEEPSRVSRTTIGLSIHSGTSSNGKDKQANWERLSVLAETANRREDYLNCPLLGLPAFTLKNNDKINVKATKNIRRKAREPISDQNNNDFAINRSLVPAEKLKCTTNRAADFFNSKEENAVASTANGRQDDSLKRLYPVWFTLLACQDKKGNPYPQIPKCYIRIKDGNLPVSYVNRYLVQKLNLRHESEVEVMCCGETTIPSATLSSLVEIWLQFISKRDGPTLRSNSNGQNFVMVLTYRRKWRNY